jgi:hypothetical protein
MPRIVTALAGAAFVWSLLLAEPGVAQTATPRGGSPASPAPTGAGSPQQTGTPPAPGTVPQPGNPPPQPTISPQLNTSPQSGTPPPNGGRPPQTGNGTGTPAPSGVGPAAQPSTSSPNGSGTTAEQAPPAAEQATGPRHEPRSRPQRWSYGGYSRWGYVTPWSGPYVIERAHGYQAFVVQGDWVRANTVCWGWKAGERVSFRPGPAGECVLVNRTRHQICPVSCERWAWRPYF